MTQTQAGRAPAGEAGGAPALRRDRRACRAGADPEDAAAARRSRHRGWPVRPPRRQRGRRARRQDARRDHQSVRQPGRLSGRDDGAGAECGDWIEQIEFPAPPTSRPPMRGSTPSSPASRRGGRHGAKPTVNYGFLGRCGSAPCPTACGASRSASPAWKSTCSGSKRLEEVFEQALDHFGMTSRGDDGQRSRLRDREPDRRRLAQPVPDQPPPLRPLGADRHRAAPLRSLLWRGATEPRKRKKKRGGKDEAPRRKR